MSHHRNALPAMATRGLAVLATCLMMAGCSSALFGALNVTQDGDGIEPVRSVVYDHGHGLALDVYRPQAAADGAPMVVYFFGGSWQNGTRERYAFVGKALAERGVVAVLPDYRLYPEVKFPAFMEDAAKAVAWARASARELGADPQRIFLMGHSAGAHIVGLLAADAQYLAAVGMQPSDLAGVIGLAGPYDVRPEGYPDLEDLFGPRERWPLARAVEFIDGNEPPFLLLHGSADGTVWAKHSELMAQRLQAAGVEADLELYPDVGHVRILMALRFPGLAPVLDDIMEFIGERHIRAAR
jgi:acetyl esterase/lipase